MSYGSFKDILVHSESQLLYKITVINYMFTQRHYLSGAGEMSAKCLRIGPILCKYHANTDWSSQQTREIEPIVILVHRLQRWPNIIPPLVQCSVFAGV